MILSYFGNSLPGEQGVLRSPGMMKSLFILLIVAATVSGANSQTADGHAALIWVALEGHTQLNKTRPGTTIEGKLARSVFWRDAEIFPKGGTVRLVVDQIESRKKPYLVDDRPFVIHVFAPRHDVLVRFRSVNVLIPGGTEVPLRATFIALSERAELGTGGAKAAIKGQAAATDPGGHAPKRKKPAAPWVLTLQVEPENTTFQALAAAHAGKQSSLPAVCPEPCTIADGTRMPVALLVGLSASQNRQGQSFRAVLLEPVLVGSAIVIPQGSILQGTLTQRVAPRRLYRPGSINLLFTGLALPNGTATVIAASPVAAEVDRETHMTMDSEGIIHAQSPGTARFLLDFAVTGGISKVTDDTTQMIIEAISTTATDASTAGVTRFVAMGATAIYMLTRHGRDVILPPYTEMDISLSRAVSLGSQSSPIQSATQVLLLPGE